MSGPGSVLWNELKGHLPYSVFATAGGILLAGIMLYVAVVVSTAVGGGTGAEEAHAHERASARDLGDHEHDHGDAGAEAHRHEERSHGAELMEHASHVTFHVFHPIHLLFSAIATAAMFWRYERKFLKAVLTGLLGSLGVCSVSDIFIPYVSGFILGTQHMEFHWCLVQHPMLVLPFAVVGVLVGMIAAETVQRSTYFSHSAHVFVSSAASIFYIVSFGMTDWADKLGMVFVFMVLAVLLPCCFSDVIFPLLVACKDPHVCACPTRHHHEEKCHGAGKTGHVGSRENRPL